MDAKTDQPTTIDEYIAQFPQSIQDVLHEVRAVIHKAAPEATERISYAMPCFYQNGNLVYFATGKNYIGFYPTGSGIEEFKEEFGDYKWSKGAVQFPLNKPMPSELITRIVQFRVGQNLAKGEAKKKTTTR